MSLPWKRISNHCLAFDRYSITVGGIGGGLVSYLLHVSHAGGRSDILASRPAIPADDQTARGRAVAELKQIAYEHHTQKLQGAA